MTKLGYLGFLAEHTFTLGLLGVDIRGMVAREVDGEIYLYTSTSMGGGATAYRLNVNGIPDLIDMQEYSGASRIPLLHDVNIVTIGGSDILLVGSDGVHQLTGYKLSDDGKIGNRYSVDWGPVDNGAAHLKFITIGTQTFVVTASENGTGLSVFEFIDDGVTLTFEISGPEILTLNSVAAMDTVTIDGTTYLLVTSASQDDVVSFKIDSSGTLTEIDTFGALDGLGISTPTGMEIVTVGEMTYVILASSVSDSLSVLRMAPDGSLSAVDHVLDTTHTRFENIGEMDVFTANGHNFVLVSGTDNGVSLFTVLPNGRLQYLESVAYNGVNGLNSISSIEVVEAGAGALQVFVASGTGEGLFQFSFDTSDLGNVYHGSATPETINGSAKNDVIVGRAGDDILNGYGGDDILIDDMGSDIFWGGTGADTFVMIPDNGGLDIIKDFERGIDILDFSNFGMLYSANQITVTSTSYGAQFTFRDEVFEIHSNDGYSLSTNDLFGLSFNGPDRPFLSVYNEMGGTPESDELIGGDGTDVIYGLAENDLIYGGYGDDILIGGDGEDTINGGSGNDRIEGGGNADTIDAGAGDDWIDGGLGPDTVTMGSGNDIYNDNTEFGTSGSDTVYGDAGDDTINGGGGDDTFDGGSGDDIITAGYGNDTVIGGSGNDTINGGQGEDNIDGGSGNDVIEGRAGNDFIRGGSGEDYINGDSAFDTIYAGFGDDTVYGGLGSDQVWLEDGDDVFEDNMQEGARGRDFVRGGAGNDRIEGGGGDDGFWGDEGNDIINGRRGNDFIHGGSGNDTIKGGSGDDTINGGAGSDTIYAGNDNDYVIGGTGSDTVWLENGDDVFEGSPQDGINGIDYIYGGMGNDTIIAGGGDDELWGDAGNDILSGGLNNDTIRGGNGNDTITGGRHNDTLTGGFGSDTFVYFAHDGIDVITDFNPNLDIIRLNIDGVDGSTLIWETTANNNLKLIYGTGSVEFEGLTMSDVDASWIEFG